MAAVSHSCRLWLGLDQKPRHIQKQFAAFLCASLASVPLTSTGVFSVVQKVNSYLFPSAFYIVVALLIYFGFLHLPEKHSLFSDWKALTVSAVLSIGSVGAEAVLIRPEKPMVLIIIIRIAGLFLLFLFAVRCADNLIRNKRIRLKAAGIAALIAFTSIIHAQSHLCPDHSGLIILKVLPHIALFCVLLFFFSGFHFAFQFKKQIGLVILAVFFGRILLLAESVSQPDAWNSIWEYVYAAVRSIILWGGMSTAMFVLLLRLEQIKVPVEPFLQHTPDRKKAFLILVCVLLILWIPYIAAQFPAGINIDTRDQFAQITGKTELSGTTQAMPEDPDASDWNNHHSALYNAYLAFFLMLGEWLHSNSAGVFMAALVQTITLACMLAYCLLEVRRRFPNRRVFRASLAFFALNPLMPLWGMTIQKDVFYGGIMMLVVLKMHHMLCETDRPSLKDTIVLGIYLLLMIALRRTGIYVAAATALIAVIMLARKRKQLYRIAAAFAASILIFQFGISGYLFSVLKIRNGSPRGTYCVPFMQTARYIADYRNEVTPEEEEAILGVIGGPDSSLDEIVENYVPVRADNVIFLYNKYCTPEQLKNYLATWAGMLVKHPDSYIQGYLSLVWPWFEAGSDHDRIYYDSVMCDDLESVLPGVERSNSGMVGFASSVVSCLAVSPLTMSFVLNAALTWMMIVVLVFLARRKRRGEVLSFLPIVFNYCIGFIGPVAYMRYSLGMLFALPFVMCLLFCNRKEKTDGQDCCADPLL